MIYVYYVIWKINNNKEINGLDKLFLDQKSLSTGTGKLIVKYDVNELKRKLNNTYLFDPYVFTKIILKNKVTYIPLDNFEKYIDLFIL